MGYNVVRSPIFSGEVGSEDPLALTLLGWDPRKKRVRKKGKWGELREERGPLMPTRDVFILSVRQPGGKRKANFCIIL